MKGYKLTRVWEIDRHLVVAPTIEEALEVYKSYMGKEYYDGPNTIRAISNSDCFCESYDALIKEEK